MSEIKVKIKPKADVVTSGGGTTANKSGGTPSKGRRGYRGGYYNGGTPQKKFEGAVEELSACIFDCQHNSQAKNFQQHLEILATYVGSKYEHGGDMRHCILTLLPVNLEQPSDPPEDSSRTVTKIWEIEITEYIKRRDKIKANLKKLFSLVWGQCTELMRTKLQQMPSFDQINAHQDSIGLIKLIKGLTFKFDLKQYAPMAMVNIDTRLYKFTQGRQVTDALYYEQFKSLVEVIEHYQGEIGHHPKLILQELEKIAEDRFDPETPLASIASMSPSVLLDATENARQKYLACLFLNGADKTRYESLVLGVTNDFVKGLDTFPKTLQDAFALLTETRCREVTKSSLEGSSFAQGGGGGNGPACWGCQEDGIVLSECTKPACMEKWKKKQEKRAANGVGLTQVDVDWDEAEDFDLYEFSSFSLNQRSESGKVPARFILLDSESTHCTFYSRSYLKDIRTTDNPILVHTNGGQMECTLEGDLPGFGAVYYNPEGIANILSMAVVESKGRRITYDSWAGGMFHVHNPDSGKITSFHKLPSGLYVHDVKAPSPAMAFVETVDENKKVFTSRQFLKAKAARELYGMLGVPSTRDYIGAIKNKLIPNVKVTVEDIKNAEIIFGKDLGAIMGKTTRDKPAPVVSDMILLPSDILKAHKEVTLSADIFFVNGVAFFTTISQHIKFVTADRLLDQKGPTILKALLRILAVYLKRGFVVVMCHMDNQFQCLEELMVGRGYRVVLNICAPDEHVPEIERSIRTGKERVRSVASTLPFKVFPELVSLHLVLYCYLWLNFFPPIGGISKTISPETVVKGRSVDAKVHCRIPFGSYAQVSTKNGPTNNAMTSRTVGGISLGPTGNIQGTYKFMSLLTGLLIKSRSFVMLPMPSEVIKQVGVFAKNQPGDIVFLDRTGSNTIGDLTTEEEGDVNDDHQDDYNSEDGSSGTEDDESLVFDDKIGEGDREVTETVENILPELPWTMGLPERQLGRIQGVGTDRDGGDGHGDEVSDSENESEEGSKNDVAENNRVTEHVSEINSERLVSNDEESNENVNQSILDLATTFEAQLDDPGLDTPPASPTVETVEDPPQDPVPNFINRFGREVKPRRFLMHEGFGALAKGEGDPELWRPSTQTSYGMHQQQAKDRCFFRAMAIIITQ